MVKNCEPARLGQMVFMGKMRSVIYLALPTISKLDTQFSSLALEQC